MALEILIHDANNVEVAPARLLEADVAHQRAGGDATATANRPLIKKIHDFLHDVFADKIGGPGRLESHLVVFGEALGIHRYALEEVKRDWRTFVDELWIHARLRGVD